MRIAGTRTQSGGGVCRRIWRKLAAKAMALRTPRGPSSLSATRPGQQGSLARAVTTARGAPATGWACSRIERRPDNRYRVRLHRRPSISVGGHVRFHGRRWPPSSLMRRLVGSRALRARTESPAPCAGREFSRAQHLWIKRSGTLHRLRPGTPADGPGWRVVDAICVQTEPHGGNSGCQCSGCSPARQGRSHFISLSN